MNTTAQTPTNPADLERQVNATREEVDRTLEAINSALSS
jgi:hypothetical protein